MRFVQVIEPEPEAGEATIGKVAIFDQRVGKDTGSRGLPKLGQHPAIGFAANQIDPQWLAEEISNRLGKRNGLPSFVRLAHTTILTILSPCHYNLAFTSPCGWPVLHLRDRIGRTAKSNCEQARGIMTNEPTASNPEGESPKTLASVSGSARPPITIRRPVLGAHRRHFTSSPEADQEVPPAAKAPAAPRPSPTPQGASTADGVTNESTGSVGVAEPVPGSESPTTTAPIANPALSSATNPAERAPLSSISERRGARPRTDAGGKREASSESPSTESLRVSLPPKPSRHDKLSDDLQMEMDAAFGDRSLDELIRGAAPAAIPQIPEPESRHRAQVIRVYGDNVFFSLTGRCEGVVSLRSFSTPPNPGDTFDVVVRGFNQEDGLCDLVVPGASVDVSDWSDLTEGALVEAKVTAANSGGLECEVNRIRGFIPASQTGLYRVENLGDFIGQKLLCVVTEANAQRRNLVLSHRAVLERQKQESRQSFYKELAVGQVREGIVRKIHDFGAFVDLGGADGLIHVSQLSWERVKHPSEVVQEGQKVQVKIEKIDADTGRIGLSLRSMTDDPWKDVEQRFPVGSMAQGTVSRIANFGAFVKLALGIEGLIHVTELAHYRVTNIGKVVQEGQEVNVKVLSVDAESQRIGLSLKAATPAPAAESSSAADGKEPEVEEAPRPLAVAKRSGPLKGGVDRSSRGENFGLKW